VIPLAVSGAFHSKLMLSASEKMREIIEAADVRPAEIPVIANVTAEYESDPKIIRENLALQVASPVRWEETLGKLTGDGFDTFLELGSGKVLTNIVKRFAKGVRCAAVSDEASLVSAIELINA
jgi:[acyl-carrier-protein] S-malonyltransferase